jgi:hypothetical protein
MKYGRAAHQRHEFVSSSMKILALVRKLRRSPHARAVSLCLLHKYTHLGWYGKPSISSTAYVTIVGILARVLGLQLGECRAAESFLPATCSTLFSSAVFQMNQWRNGPSSIRGLLDALANGHTMLKIPVLVKSPKPRLALGRVTVWEHWLHFVLSNSRWSLINYKWYTNRRNYMMILKRVLLQRVIPSFTRKHWGKQQMWRKLVLTLDSNQVLRENIPYAM